VRKLFTVSTLAVAVLLLWAGPAAAHAGFMPNDVAPGVLTEGEVVVVHGCGPDGTIPANDDEELATTAVILQRPDGLKIDPQEVEGWTLSTETDDVGDVIQARWAADDPAGELGAIFLGVEVTADEDADGSSIWVHVVQECGEDEQLAWVAERIEELEGELPAMLVNVDSAAVLASQPSPSTGGLSTGVIVTLAVALAVLAGGGVAMFSARRG
jgi:uncharacterized protein YcnI